MARPTANESQLNKALSACTRAKSPLSIRRASTEFEIGRKVISAALKASGVVVKIGVGPQPKGKR